jgi:hypothetical protein
VAGVVRAALLDCSGTSMATGASPLSAIAQVAVWPGPSVDGAQLNDVNTGRTIEAGAVRLKLAGAEDPIALAVTVTV